MKFKPFNINEVSVGDTVYNNNGKNKYTILSSSKLIGNPVVIYNSEGTMFTYNSEGRYYSRPSDMDLLFTLRALNDVVLYQDGGELPF